MDTETEDAEVRAWLWLARREAKKVPPRHREDALADAMLGLGYLMYRQVSEINLANFYQKLSQHSLHV